MPKIVDLTLTLHPGMRGVAIAPKFTISENGWNASTYELYSHAGTHMDAPVHFVPGAPTIDMTPTSDFMGRAWVLDQTDIKPGGEHTLSGLGALKDRFSEGDSLLVHTNWSRHVDDSTTYRDRLPRINQELAEWLVKKGAKMLLVEAPSVADVNNLEEVTLIHQILLKGGVTIVEGLTNVDHLDNEQVFILALPLKVRNGDGSPARVIAVDNSTDKAMNLLTEIFK